MKGRVVALVVLVLALLAAAIWFALKDAPPVDDAPVAPVVQGTVAAKSASADAAEPRKRARAGRTWIELGAGDVIGAVREYGTEKPLAGLAVTLSAGLPGPDRTLESRTGADGAFRFAGVPNFDDWTLRVDAAEPLADVEQAGVSVVENKLTDLGAIYVTPAYEVPGIVVDDKGDPVPGAEVRALRVRAAGSQMDILRLIRELPTDVPSVDKATTGADGRFALTKTSPGTYDFKIVKAGKKVQVEREVVITPDSAKRDLRFVLSTGFQLDGKVVRKGPGEIAGIPVVAFHQPQGEFDFLVLDRTYATTDETGAFHLDGLGGGRYVVSATPEGEPFALEDDVQIPATTFVEIVIEGDAWLEGRVTGKAGAAVAGAQVYVATFDGKPVVGNARTDGEGRYSIRGLKSGKVQLFLVQAEGYATWPSDLMSMLQGGGASGLELKPGRNERDVSLEPGGVIRGVVTSKDDDSPLEGVRVELGSILSMFGGTRGATTDASGKFEITSTPMGATVLVLSKDGWFQPGMSPMAMMQAFQPGKGKQPDSGKGYVVQISEPGQVVERKLSMARGSTLVGQVLTPDGTPMAGARVSLRAEGDGGGFMDGLSVLFGTSDPRLTDAEGRFEMPGPQPGTKARVVATSQGFLEGTSDPVAAGVGQRVEGITVRLRRGATIEGLVTDAAGRPLEGALVKWIATAKLNEWEVRWRLQAASPAVTDADGRYRVEHVEPGKVMVEISHAKHLPETVKDLTTEEGKATEVHAKLALGAVVAGRVLGPDGAPRGAATVVLDRVPDGSETEQPRWGGQDTRRGTTAADGSFNEEGLEPGAYDVHAEAKGAAPSETVRATAGGPALTLRLQQALRIGGVVRVQGRPTAQVAVTLQRRTPAAPAAASANGMNAESWEHVANEQTGADGSFLFEDLAQGDYQLEFAPGNFGEDRANVLRKKVPDVRAGSEGLAVELEAGLEIRGTVLLESGEPAQNGWVTATPVATATDGSSAATGPPSWGNFENGELRVLGLAPGTYDLQINVGGAGNKKVRAEAGTTDLRVVVGGGGKVTGLVLNADGTAATNVWVNASGPQGGQGAMCDVEGRYTIAGLEAGSYRIDARRFGGGKNASGSTDGVSVRVGDTTEAPTITLREE